SQGRVLLTTERLDLVQLVRDSIEDGRSFCEEAGLTLSLELPEEAVWVEGDPARLSQVVGNLLRNAAKFTDPGGSVTVTVGRWALGVGSWETPSDLTPDAQRLTPPAAVLTVRDTGIGIAPELLPHVFDPFAQGEQSRDR